jgi:hypothetical protein
MRVELSYRFKIDVIHVALKFSIQQRILMCSAEDLLWVEPGTAGGQFLLRYE